ARDRRGRTDRALATPRDSDRHSAAARAAWERPPAHASRGPAPVRELGRDPRADRRPAAPSPGGAAARLATLGDDRESALRPGRVDVRLADRGRPSRAPPPTAPQPTR